MALRAWAENRVITKRRITRGLRAACPRFVVKPPRWLGYRSSAVIKPQESAVVRTNHRQHTVCWLDVQELLHTDPLEPAARSAAEFKTLPWVTDAAFLRQQREIIITPQQLAL